MQKEVNANIKDLLEMDRHFRLEAEFLNCHADKFILDKVHELVIAALPSDDKKKFSQVVPNGIIQEITCLSKHGICGLFQFVAVLVELDMIKRSPLCFAGGNDLEGEVSGIIGLVRGLMEQVGPTEQYLGNCSTFYKYCLKLMENFITVEVPNEEVSAGKISFKEPSILFGRKALCYQFEKFNKEFQKGVKKELPDVQLFRTFNYVLSPHQQLLSANWVTELLKNHMSKFKEIKDTSHDDGVKGVGKVVNASSGGSSSSSTGIMVPASAALAQAASVCGTSFGKVSSKKVVTEGVDVFSFFGGKMK
jgi:hypothetical protein